MPNQTNPKIILPESGEFNFVTNVQNSNFSQNYRVTYQRLQSSNPNAPEYQLRISAAVGAGAEFLARISTSVTYEAGLDILFGAAKAAVATETAGLGVGTISGIEFETRNNLDPYFYRYINSVGDDANNLFAGTTSNFIGGIFGSQNNTQISVTPEPKNQISIISSTNSSGQQSTITATKTSNPNGANLISVSSNNYSQNELLNSSKTLAKGNIGSNLTVEGNDRAINGTLINQELLNAANKIFKDQVTLDSSVILRLSSNPDDNIFLAKDSNQSIDLKDDSTSTFDEVVSMLQSSYNNLNKFIFNQVSEFASSYQEYLVDNKEQMVGDIISRVLLGESLQEAMVAVAQVWGVNALLNNKIASESLNGIISEFSNDAQITAGVQAGVVAFLSTVLIAELRGDSLNGEQYTEAGVKAATIGAVAYFMPGTPVGPIIALIDGAIQGIENREDLDSQGWQDLGTSTAAAVASATVGLVVGMEVGASIGTAVFPGFGTIVGAVVGALVGAILYQPLSNLFHDSFEANEEIYDAIEDTIIKLNFSVNNLEENARQIARAIEDLAKAYTINLVGSIC